MNTDEIKRLTRQLEVQNDVSLEEADKIYAFLARDVRQTAINPFSLNANYELIGALTEWFHVVGRKLKKGRRGNFIFSIFLHENGFNHNYLNEAWDALKKYGKFEDHIGVIWVSRPMYSLLPGRLRDMFTLSEYEGLYKLLCRRAGFFYYPQGECNVLSQFIKKLSPITGQLSRSGTSYIMEHVKHIVPYIEAADFFEDKAVIFTEKDKAPLMKVALETPFEELVRNALNENAIDEQAARKLLSNERPSSVAGFIETSMKYLNNIAKMKKEWQFTTEAVENESGWLEEIR
jgi:hypothetical protein